MTFIRVMFLLGAGALAYAIFWAMGADARGLGPVLAEMLSEPWTVVTLIDLYLGFFIAAAIIALFEKRPWVAAFWAAPVFLLGNVWAALWFAWRLAEISKRLRRWR